MLQRGPWPLGRPWSCWSFQTPSAGRWVLQQSLPGRGRLCSPVSNPISGEVGAAAGSIVQMVAATDGFQTPSAGRWVLQLDTQFQLLLLLLEFQTPSAGRWVLQRLRLGFHPTYTPSFKPHQRGGGCCSRCLQVRCRSRLSSFKPHQRGGGCCSQAYQSSGSDHRHVSNPISGEVGAAARFGLPTR